MSKRRKLEVADTTQWSTAAAVPLNWDLCILCQTRTCEPLICPTVAGYTSLINNLSRFAELNALPRSINLEQMDDGSGVLTTLTTKGAKYHKVCRNKYDAQKVSRLSSPETVISDTECPSINTRSSTTVTDIKTSCVFCNGGPTAVRKLINASTTHIGPKIHAQAVEMQDTKLLAKLASTDFIAMEVKYHTDCYTSFRNSYRSHQRLSSASTPHPHRLTYGSVMSELIQYIQELFLYSNTAPVFKLSDLTKLFVSRMTSLGAPTDEKSINRTRLKEQLIELIPGLRADKAGREVFLSFEANVGHAVHEACAFNVRCASSEYPS